MPSVLTCIGVSSNVDGAKLYHKQCCLTVGVKHESWLCHRILSRLDCKREMSVKNNDVTVASQNQLFSCVQYEDVMTLQAIPSAHKTRYVIASLPNKPLDVTLMKRLRI